MGYFWSPLIVMLNTMKCMMAVLVCRFYDICKYKASLGTAKRSRWTALRNYRFRVRLGPGLTFFLAPGHCATVRFSKLLPGIIVLGNVAMFWITYAFFIRHPRK